MGLQEKIKNAMIEAMKRKEEARLSAIRMIRSALKNMEIEKRTELTDGDVMGVLQKLAKQRQDSIELYQKGGRADLVEKENLDLRVIHEFLPPQLGEAEISACIEDTMREIKPQGMKDMGKLMKEVMSRLQGPVDGKLVSELVKKKLTV